VVDSVVEVVDGDIGWWFGGGLWLQYMVSISFAWSVFVLWQRATRRL
jgi:hypothetical protein